MAKETLKDIHLACLARYAAIFPKATAEGYASAWWIWAGRNLDRELYETIRKARWETAGRIERLAAKQWVPGS